MWQPGDFVNDNFFYVYALLDEEWVEVYIGMTRDPYGRRRTHLGQPSPNLRELMDQGYKPVMRILARFTSESAALAEEKRLIETLQPLLNTNHIPDDDYRLGINGKPRDPEAIRIIERPYRIPWNGWYRAQRIASKAPNP